MKTEDVINTKAGLMLILSFVAMGVVNGLILAIAHFIMPTHIVLGTQSLSMWWALAIATSVITSVGVASIPLMSLAEVKRKKLLQPKDWMIAYFLINFVTIWLVARGSNQLGMGITSWVVALVLAVILDFLQGIVMMALEKNKDVILKKVLA